MKVMVCLKQVPHQDARLDVNADGTWIDDSNIKFEINSYDTYALEQALQIKDASGGEVVVCSVGPDRASQAIKTALAMGADRAVHVNDSGVEGADSLGLARVLHAVAAGESFDLTLMGLQAEDDNNGQVGPMLARLLEIPCATGVIGFQLADDGRSVRIIDQTRLPHEFVIAELRGLEDAARAISSMQVRGAPLIGGGTRRT